MLCSLKDCGSLSEAGEDVAANWLLGWVYGASHSSDSSSSE